MPEPKKLFTQEFRDEAVRLAETSGRSRREVASDLGIGLSTLWNWINPRRERQVQDPPDDRQGDMATELKEREILKRATAFSPRREVDEVPAHRCGTSPSSACAKSSGSAKAAT